MPTAASGQVVSRWRLSGVLVPLDLKIVERGVKMASKWRLSGVLVPLGSEITVRDVQPVWGVERSAGTESPLSQKLDSNQRKKGPNKGIPVNRDPRTTDVRGDKSVATILGSGV